LILRYRFLPESPRWLLAKGRIEEALKILETLARVNGTVLPDSFKKKLKVCYSNYISIGDLYAVEIFVISCIIWYYVSVNRKIVAHYHIIYAIINNNKNTKIIFSKLKYFLFDTSKMQNIRCVMIIKLSYKIFYILSVPMQ